jgi:polyisoprenyl-phosphate glycosyltransferase
MTLVTVLTPCFNEEDNVREVYERVRAVFLGLPGYEREHLFIDNASTDATVQILRELAAEDPAVKVIVNTRNFGHVRSPYYGLLEGTGACVIAIVADLQDPPDLIPEFIRQWEQGYKVVIGVRESTDEGVVMRTVRNAYYTLVRKLSDVEQIPGFTGFGLYDAEVIETLRKIDDPYPYFRGLICDLGYQRAAITYHQKVRKRGITKNNFFTLYDVAMLGITNHSKVPLRLATMTGFTMSLISLLVAIGYLIAKLVFWNSLQMGMAPLVIGLYLLASVLLLFIGILGEYIGAIHTQVQRRPLVIERERINFDPPVSEAPLVPAGVEGKVPSGPGEIPNRRRTL